MDNQRVVLPILKDANWPHAERVLCRRLADHLSSPYLPWLAFGYDQVQTFEFLSKDQFPGLNGSKLKLIEQAAVRNFADRPAAWQSKEIRLGWRKKTRLLVCTEDFLSAERILDRDFMQEAQRQLSTHMLLVGIPRRGLMLAIDGTQTQGVLESFANMISVQYHRADTAPITPMCFAIADGKIIGMLKGGEEVGKAIVQAERKNAGDEPYVSSLVATQGATGQEAAYIMAGGPNIEKLSRGIEQAFHQVLQGAATRDRFNGQVHIVIMPDITPHTPEVRSTLAALREHLEHVACDLASLSMSPHAIQVALEYGERGAVDSPLLGPAALETWRAALQAEDVERRLQAVEALGCMRGQEAIRLLIQSLGDPDARVCFAAAHTLAGTGDPAIAPLLSALGDPGPVTRKYALAALEEIGPQNFLDAFVAALHDVDPEVRYQAAGALNQVDDPALLDPFLARLADEDPAVRAAAAVGLGHLRRPQAADALMAALRDPAWNVRCNAVQALVQIGERRAAAAIIPLLRDANGLVRAVAARASGELGDPQAIPFLLETLGDAHELAHKNAVEAIVAFGGAAVKPLKEARRRLDKAAQAERYELLTDIQGRCQLRQFFGWFKPKRAR
jgi:HEAT repeat protein/uncharacterized protein YtpQ (UPF0354 family)